ncbi:MAG: sulfate reduction electron transfer complex DsrMKJOP subunit DsrM [Desulfomonile tiedjei]|uniref:Sulfate reduction electron transfer complex DsrMKJOP subunit DsrM n=1 Tax=Desulfomonile tiedjei TaxID=2358 RepID=A0A9D6Z5N2_9BACT|nr:sulfate reduction electron transfer complex DsrMKJOP subunit DsrM [Desulfomonile tiedjei]
MNAWTSLFASLIAVIALVLVALFGVGAIGLDTLFGVVIPYIAIAVFVVGIIYRILEWAKVPVPFRIPTTCGQGKSLPWIKADNLESPYNTWGVIGRMALEVFLFRSLFRNTKAELREGPNVTYGSAKWLWLGGIAFHYAFLTIVLRHIRFFVEPIPSFVELLSSVDGFFQLLVPTVFLTDIALLAAATFLFLRRVFLPQLRYISLAADFFPLLLILGIAISGVLMRNVWKVDLLMVKQLAVGLFTLHPTVPAGISSIFYVHLFLVCVLLVYFPFSKLMHAGGVFLSPTRNTANVNRMERYVNPWNYPVKVHSYAEYEDDFREKMKEAGIPVDKE